MRGRYVLAAMASFILTATAAAAVNLSRIDRSLVKEPAYESKRPQYCLLVFGQETRTRVWLVLDGDMLYLDRHGNGDLTDPDDRISPHHVWHRSKERPNIEVIRGFFLRTTPKGGPEGGPKPVLTCMPDVTALIVEQIVPSDDEPNKSLLELRRKKPFWVCTGSASGWEQGAHVAFADQPGNAPILHFFGPQQVTWDDPKPLKFQKGEMARFLVGLWTPGLGGDVGTVSLPNTCRAVAEVEFPAGWLGNAAAHRRVELKDPGG